MIEQDAIALTTRLSGSPDTYSVSKSDPTVDKIFLLTEAEARNGAYFPNGNASRASSSDWWLQDAAGGYQTVRKLEERMV